MLFARNPFGTLAATVAFAVIGGCPRLAFAAIEVTAADCADLGIGGTLPVPPMTDDVIVTLSSSRYECEEETTIVAYGAHSYTVVSPHATVLFSNVRFEIWEQAEFFLNIETKATFTGVEHVGSSGGVFWLFPTCTATFNCEVQFDENKVSDGDFSAEASGGAIYADGEVTFNKRAEFYHNRSDRRQGGAMFVPTSGTVTFRQTSLFVENGANGDFGFGGAITNLGKITFRRNSEFEYNTSSVAGGALMTGAESTTEFLRRVSMSEGSSIYGGGIYNQGTLTVNNKATFVENTALENGGHINARLGTATFNSRVIFTNGDAGDRGGAAYATSGDVLNLSSEHKRVYSGNTAAECDDLYIDGADPVCQQY